MYTLYFESRIILFLRFNHRCTQGGRGGRSEKKCHVKMQQSTKKDLKRGAPPPIFYDNPKYPTEKNFNVLKATVRFGT
jgi:hypothetical protein